MIALLGFQRELALLEKLGQLGACNSASDLDALYIAADLIGEVADPEQRAALTAVFEERQFALESA